MGESQLDIVIEVNAAGRALGVASRYGFELPWSALHDGSVWTVEVPRGHSLGPDGKGAFEVVTDEDWPRFVGAVHKALSQQRAAVRADRAGAGPATKE